MSCGSFMMTFFIYSYTHSDIESSLPIRFCVFGFLSGQA